MQLSRKKKPMNLSRSLRRHAVNYAALVPFFALFFFILVPMIQGLAMSFTD